MSLKALARKVLERDTPWDKGGTGLSQALPEKAPPVGQHIAPPGEPVTDPELKPFDTGDYEERAAMVEYGAGAPRAWAEGYARLCTLPRPPDYTETRWQGLIDDAGLFLDQWATQVDRLGWKTQEVFGVHHAKPSTRIDLQGLVPCIRGRKVVAVTANSATIETITGARQRIFRRTDAQSPGRVAVWEIDPKDENACPPRQ